MRRPPSIIHVGFANSGTTSLQRNFFSQRDDIFFVGEPYRERGGIFTLLRHAEDFKYDEAYVRRLCNQQIYGGAGKRRIIISDEALTESPQLYFAPYLLPRDVIAARLSRLFDPAKIIFTIRNQEHYVSSMYLNLKRNSAFLARAAIVPLSRWYKGMLSQYRCCYLQNVDFNETISLYETIFQRENILVLPLECLTQDGRRDYLQRVCDFVGLKLSTLDVERFARPQNARMSALKDGVAEFMCEDRFFAAYLALQQAVGADSLEQVLDQGERADATLAGEDLADLRRRVAAGNRALGERYSLDLHRYGYPLTETASPLRQEAVVPRGGEPIPEDVQVQSIADAEQRASARWGTTRRPLVAGNRGLAVQVDPQDSAAVAQSDAEYELAALRIRSLEADQEARRQAVAAYVAELRRQVEEFKESIYTSRSWQVTAPLRQLTSLLRRCLSA